MVTTPSILLTLLLLLVFHLTAWPAEERTGGPPPSPVEAEYHTPLAGEPYHTLLFGRAVDIPGRDRGNDLALALGWSSFSPSQMSDDGVPILALYWKRTGEAFRLRLLTSLFENELDAARSLGGPAELLGRFESATDPIPQAEVVSGHEVKSTSLQWGTLSGLVGAGVRFPVAPYQADNDLRLQLFARLGYFYAGRVGDSGPGVRPPPDTVIYGLKARGRYDGFRRNLLELPHAGFAAGFDLDLVRRDRWGDGSNGGATFPASDSRDYVRGSGYLQGAAGVPGLSERDRLLFSLYGGWASNRSVDRFNAFRLGGGPLPDESDDLSRPDYPGSDYNKIPLANYLMSSLEYRRELLFFLFLHLRGTLFWADRPDVTGPSAAIRHEQGHALSAALTSGFYWHSRLYLEYAWDSGLLRDGAPGSSVMIFWAKSLGR